MIKELATNLVNLKKEFSKKYAGNGQLKEVIPLFSSNSFQIPQQDLELLHKFATSNPIYYNSFEMVVNDIPCIVYEGDINKFWLNSIQHTSSCAPFSPTWIMSAYVGTLLAKSLGYKEVIDIGSGDGRIAFCAKLLNLQSFSIEIDEMLVNLQKQLIQDLNLNFNPYCYDAISFDYSSLNLVHPIFFIGGLSQMGGNSLASGILDKITSVSIENTGWVFAGTYSQKYAPDPKNQAGWGTLIENNNLKLIQTISLPTAWTFSESDETPYVFTEFCK